MTYTDVYVGRLANGPDPLDWGGKYTLGNIPRADVGAPVFPPTSAREEPFRRLIKKIESQELAGKRVDWGAWAANVSKQEIMNFIKECYSEAELASAAFTRLIELQAAVAALPDERFALIAEEF